MVRCREVLSLILNNTVLVWIVYNCQFLIELCFSDSVLCSSHCHSSNAQSSVSFLEIGVMLIFIYCVLHVLFVMAVFVLFFSHFLFSASYSYVANDIKHA